MAKTKTVRFATGTPETPFSSVWRLIIQKNDVYLGASKESMGMFKISLHESGVWLLATTEQSKATFGNMNRRAKRWMRPLEHFPGVTRGPSIIVPNTSLGSRSLLPSDVNKDIIWHESPAIRETIEFSLYFVKPRTPTKWSMNETVISECSLANGSNVVLLASRRQSPEDFNATVEKILRENIVRMNDPSNFTGGSLLWITESHDEFSVPLIIDLPVPIGLQSFSPQPNPYHT